MLHSMSVALGDTFTALTPAARRLLAVVLLCFSVLSVQAITAQRADALSWDWRWYGGDALLNRSETQLLKSYYGGATTVAEKVPHPYVQIATVAFRLQSAYATWVYDRGGCLKFRFLWNAQPVPGHYYRGYCR